MLIKNEHKIIKESGCATEACLKVKKTVNGGLIEEFGVLFVHLEFFQS